LFLINTDLFNIEDVNLGYENTTKSLFQFMTTSFMKFTVV